VPPSTSKPTTFGQLPPSRWPGERLGLPDTGPLSVGRAGRRMLGLLIDYALAMALAFTVFRYTFLDYNGFVVTGTYVLLQVVFIPTIGGSIGHRLVGLQVIPIAGGWVGPWRPIVRSVLLGLAFPALVWDSDQRGFHDKVAGTVLVRV